MRYAVIADIHANLSALQAVLKDIQDQRCDQTACLGDVVGYNQFPKECVDVIRNLEIPCVKGNHDEYCSIESPLEGFNPRAAEFVQWTHDQLSEEDRGWLRQLPYVLEVSGFTLVHATLDEPGKWGYVFDRMAAAAHFQKQETAVCFFGHTHVPVAFVREPAMPLFRQPRVRGGSYEKFKIERGKKYLINVGSVGQPRDGNKRAAYGIYDLDERSVELRRLDYPGSDSGGRGPGDEGPSSPVLNA